MFVFRNFHLLYNPIFSGDRMISTDDDLTYKFDQIYGDTLTFSVSCSNDAHIALTSGPEETEPMYQIFFGGWENQSSAIRLNNDRKFELSSSNSLYYSFNNHSNIYFVINLVCKC